MFRRFYREWQKTEYKYPSFLTIAAGLSLYSMSIPLLPLAWLSAGVFGLGFASIKLVQIGMDFYNQITDTIAETQATIQNLNEQIEPTMTGLNQTVTQARTMIHNVNSRIAPAATQLNQTVTQTRQLIQTVRNQVEPTVNEINQTVTQARGMLNTINSQVEPTMSQVNQTVAEARGMINTINGQVEPTMSQVNQTVAKTHQTIAETRQLIQTINAQVEPTVTEVNQTVAQARVMINTINAQVEPTVGKLITVLDELEKTFAHANSGAETLESGANTLKTLAVTPFHYLTKGVETAIQTFDNEGSEKKQEVSDSEEDISRNYGANHRNESDDESSYGFGQVPFSF